MGKVILEIGGPNLRPEIAHSGELTPRNLELLSWVQNLQMC